MFFLDTTLDGCANNWSWGIEKALKLEDFSALG